jgi:malate dehydrogenase (oxaloacetate-decarboxylating)
MPVDTSDDLSIAYSPGVAAPCLEIEKNKSNSYVYTNRKNTIAIVSDGTAVLGLGNIGPEAAMPVMEGKAILFKKFANIDVLPIVINAKNKDEIVNFVQMLEPSIAGVNLEDIAAPDCVYIERKLKEKLKIPVFHDDQHGTAIVVAAALMNSARLTKKKLKDLTVVISGTGAAGSSIARMLKALGIQTIYAYNRRGMVVSKARQSFVVKELINEKIITLFNKKCGPTLIEGIEKIDIFIGVSAPKILTLEMVKSMNPDP